MMEYHVTLFGVTRISYLLLGVYMISLQTESVSVSGRSLTQDLGKRAIKDTFTPHDPPFRWAAIGDSYTAGPGAGDPDPSNEGKCMRSTGSYAPQLQKDWPYTGDHEIQFLACTAAKTPQVLDNQIPAIPNDPARDVVVLTIGGNDVGFSKIIKSCLMNLIGSGNCDDKINTARTTFQSKEFRDKLHTIYDKIFDKMPADFHYQIIQFGYSKFFNAEDDSTWCNDRTFGKVPFTISPPKLTLELRRKLNQLTDDFNVLLWTIVLSYANQKLSQDGAKEKGWLINRIFFGSLDTTDGGRSFEGHRFCELGVEDRKFQDPRTWFFGVWGEQDDTEVTASYFGNYDASSCASDPQYEADEAYAFDCDMAIYYASPGADKNAPTITGKDFVRSFHPKTVGFTQVKQYLSDKMTSVRVAPAQGACIQAPQNVDLNRLNASQTGFPRSLCATGNTFATALAPTPSSSSTPPPTPNSVAPPVCIAGSYTTDQNCGGKCKGAGSCQCQYAGYGVQNLACYCTCPK